MTHPIQHKEKLVFETREEAREVLPKKKDDNEKWKKMTPEERLIEAVKNSDTYLGKEYCDGFNACREEILKAIDKLK